MWRVENGKRTATMNTSSGVIRSLAVSVDGKWLAACTYKGVYLWDISTHEQVLKVENSLIVFDVDFSPDASRLVCAVYKLATI